jgi:hypothetical protein
MNPSNLDDDDQTIRIELYYMKNINTVNDFLQINNNIKINNASLIKPFTISLGNGTNNMGESNPHYESPSASPTPDSSNSSNNSSTFGHSFTCSVTGATVTSLIR